MALFLVVSTSVSATIATYSGDLEKSHPEATYEIGVGAEEELELDLKVENQEGLNITYENQTMFDPNESEKVLQASDGLSLNTLEIHVESVDPVEETYEIPVQLNASEVNQNSSNASGPEIVHRRDYTLIFDTDYEQVFGFDGDLIQGDTGNLTEEQEQQLEDQRENTLTEENQTEITGEETEEAGPNTTTYLLALMISMLLGYTALNIVQ